MEPQLSGKQLLLFFFRLQPKTFRSINSFRLNVAFGLPPTPPSSLSSDDSEGNQSPEHHSSPMSPPTPLISSRRTPSIQGGQNTNSSSRAYTGTSSRQPIHTPLISSQPVSHFKILSHWIVFYWTQFSFLKFSERINRIFTLNRRRETHTHCRRLSNSYKTSTYQSRRKVFEEN